MPATVSYVTVAPSTAIPIRVFVNRKRILLLSTVAVNEKSIIKLSSINLLRLSNYDLNKLIYDLQEQLKEFVLHTPLKELVPQKSVLRTTKITKEVGVQWKCKVVVSLGYVIDLRYKLGHIQGPDVQYLEEKNLTADPVDSANSSLITKEIKFGFMQTEEGDDEVASDDKKALRYKLHRQNLYNNRVVDPLVLYVLQRPRG